MAARADAASAAAAATGGGAPPQTPSPPPSGSPTPASAGVDYEAVAAEEGVTLVPGSPFTRRILSTSMPEAERRYYTRLCVASVVAAIADARAVPGGPPPPAMDVTLLLPLLDPELDIYDHAGAVAAGAGATAISEGSADGDAPASTPSSTPAPPRPPATGRVRVAIQSAEKFGGLPISVAGLRRTLEADRAASADAWGGLAAATDAVRVSDIDPAAVAPDDAAVVVLSPTNTTGAPVVDDVVAMAAAAAAVAAAPLVVLNGRLGDVASAGGVMGARGRAERLAFLASAARPFYLKLLYATGSRYPVRGALLRLYPGPWTVWAHDADADTYEQIGEFPGAAGKPGAGQLTDVFEGWEFRRACDRRAASKGGGERGGGGGGGGGGPALDAAAAVPLALAVTTVAAIVAARVAHLL
ncbi:hypothetical protein I4F81_003194 [Pyropia yezoensis]|uniref:Uncharacterized protein n=1 Tax=Pyropia yezoensis TaxID=2788 RepID=A0ACC3BSC0_PYRYE|nr:hypothetical protein I4F81_003194 [Neopyropia yezoensis]